MRGRLQLVLIGKSLLPIPKHPRIHHLGFLDDRQKFDAMAAADVLIMPSYFESLSMVALEAWALGKPVLANGRCDVLKGQAIRSNAGLYYENVREFAEALDAIVSKPSLPQTLGRNGASTSRATTRGRSSSASISRCSTAVERDRRRAAGRWSRCLASSPAAVPNCPRPENVLAAFPSGPSRHDEAAVHQVLATLGYGDAIGHEVLGIQRVSGGRLRVGHLRGDRGPAARGPDRTIAI